MLQPKKTKFRKAFKGRIHGLAKGGTDLNFGSYGLKAMEPERITARQIEAARPAISRAIKRQGRLWISLFPHAARKRVGEGKRVSVMVDSGGGSNFIKKKKIK